MLLEITFFIGRLQSQVQRLFLSLQNIWLESEFLWRNRSETFPELSQYLTGRFFALICFLSFYLLFFSSIVPWEITWLVLLLLSALLKLLYCITLKTLSFLLFITETFMTGVEFVHLLSSYPIYDKHFLFKSKINVSDHLTVIRLLTMWYRLLVYGWTKSWPILNSCCHSILEVYMSLAYLLFAREVGLACRVLIPVQDTVFSFIKTLGQVCLHILSLYLSI